MENIKELKMKVIRKSWFKVEYFQDKEEFSKVKLS